MRAVIGWVTVILGLIMFGVGVRYHSTLWTGVRTKTVVKEVAKESTKKTDDDEAETGEIRIENRWHYVDKDCEKDQDKCVPNGEYQVRDKDNRIWVMKFCNEPPPNIKEGSVVDIKYLTKSSSNCTVFANAKVIWEPLK